MINEIGSEFWSDDWDKCNNNFFQQNSERKFFLSGRTALDYIIKDAKTEWCLDTIYLPSYCCHTMIDPFFTNGIAVKFYNILVNEKGGITYDIPNIASGEALYIIKYFGYVNHYPAAVREAMENGRLIIEDETHSCFSNTNSFFADYTFISFRKWIYLSGVASACKNKSKFLIPVMDKVNDRYVSMRNESAMQKRDFILNEIGNKEKFLRGFNESEKILETDYQSYSPDAEALEKLKTFNIETMKKKRRTNAAVLLKGLKEIEGIQPIFKTLTSDDCPLFVPVMVSDCKRNELRNHLINKEIYCPVHWPLSQLHDGISKDAHKLYGEELSLICDQRYETADMKRIIKEIKSFF